MGARRKYIHAAVSVASTATSGTTGGTEVGGSFDDVVAWINTTTLTAGTVTYAIQASSDGGTSWFTVPEQLGDTGALNAIGAHRVAARAPIGSMHRLSYTIATGPCAFNFRWEFSKRGMVK